MSGVLLDTSVISELTRPVPAPPVIAFLSVQDDLWLSALVLHELELGLASCLAGAGETRCAACCRTSPDTTRTVSSPSTRRPPSGPPAFARRPANKGVLSTWEMR